jgi:acyl-CoA synthetase (NDP forming)
VAPAKSLGRLLRPRSIAVFGGRPAVEVIRQNDRIGFAGEIWPVHPRLDRIEGRPTYRSVDELPAAPDAAFVAVNRHLTADIMSDLARRGAGGAICYASGFSESGESDLQAALINAAGPMPFLGPNCYGLVNYVDGALLWPDQHGGGRVDRGVAIVTQSGNIGLNLTMQKRALPIAHLATLGNQADIGLSAMIEALLDDGRVTAIGLHIEGIDDPGRLAQAASRAMARRVPIVAIKTGRSAAGAALAVSHTASLGGGDRAADAFFRQAGIVRVQTLPVLLETLKLLHLGGPLPGRAIASMSCSGGEAALIADAVEPTSLQLRPLNAERATAVAATLPALVTVSNPLDYHTFSWRNGAALTRTFAAMMAAEFDLTLLALDFPRPDRCDDADWVISADAMVAAARETGKRAAVVATLPECFPESHAAALAAAGVAPLFGLDDALAAIAAAAEAGDFIRTPTVDSLFPSLPRKREPMDPFERTDGWVSAVAGMTPFRNVAALSEWQGKQALSSHGVVVPAGRLVTNADRAVEAAETIGFPVVLKAVGAHIAHKTEIGAVRLNLGDPDSVRAAARALLPIGDALLVERMIPDAVAELIVGIQRDPVFGLCLVIGSGGVLVELIGDSALLLPPATAADIHAALNRLKVMTLLRGYRGRPGGDIGAAVEAILAIQSFALDHQGQLMELDVNPLIVRPPGMGAVAVDVLIRMGGQR